MSRGFQPTNRKGGSGRLYSIFFEPSAHTPKPQKKSSHTCQRTRQHTERWYCTASPPRPKQGKWNLKLKVTRATDFTRIWCDSDFDNKFLTDISLYELQLWVTEVIADIPPARVINSYWAVATGIQPVLTHDFNCWLSCFDCMKLEPHY